MEKIDINGIEYEVRMVGSTGKNAYARVRNGAIIISIPISWPREEGFKAFCELRKKMIAKISNNPEKFVKKKEVEFHDGDRISVWGRDFVISVSQGNSSTSYAFWKDEGSCRKIYISLAHSLDEEGKTKHISNLARRVISQTLLPRVAERVNEINKRHFQVKIGRVFIKDNISSWGSCSNKGNVNINFRLLFAPEEVFNYVVIHELAHFNVKSHSKEFWSAVEKAMPDYKEKARWLKDNGRALGPAVSQANNTSHSLSKD